jgi:hypothetical protein
MSFHLIEFLRVHAYVASLKLEINIINTSFANVILYLTLHKRWKPVQKKI